MLGTGLGLGLGATVATAVPPLDTDPLPAIVDERGLLGRDGEVEVQEAIDELADERGVDLHLVLVSSFEGMSGPDWADATFDRAGLGEGDVLVAVAVDERRYGYVEQTDASTDEAAGIALRDIEPHLRELDWASAGEGAAEGYGYALSPYPWGRYGSVWAIILGGLGAAGSALVGRSVHRSRSRRRRAGEELASERAEVVQLLTRTRELSERAATEQDYVGAQLGEDEAAHLLVKRQQADADLDTGALALAGAPADAPRTPRQSDLVTWADAVEAAKEALTAAHQRLSAVLARIDLARELQRDTGRLDDLAAAVAGRRARGEGLRSGLRSLGAGSWLHEHVETLLEHADAALDVSGLAHGEATTSLAQGRAGDAAERVLHGEQARDKAEALLARAADPQGELAQAMEELTPLVTRVRTLLTEARAAETGAAGQSAATIPAAAREEWGRVDRAKISASVQAGEAALTDFADSPPQRRAALETSAAQLLDVIQPYRALVQAIAAAQSASSSSGRSRRSGGSRSSGSRRSGGSRSSGRSSGGGRF